MSCVSIFRPQIDTDDEPTIIPFPRLHRRSEPKPTSHFVAARARLLRENRKCDCCGSAAVDPIELNDGVLNQSGRIIPGTGTVVAFHCNKCAKEWPALKD